MRPAARQRCAPGGLSHHLIGMRKQSLSRKYPQVQRQRFTMYGLSRRSGVDGGEGESSGATRYNAASPWRQARDVLAALQKSEEVRYSNVAVMSTTRLSRLLWGFTKNGKIHLSRLLA